jgi:hypothetical protein
MAIAGPPAAARTVADSPTATSPGSGVFPEGFLPSLDAVEMPAPVNTFVTGPPRAAPRPVETTVPLPVTPAPSPPPVTPPDADGVIDGEARVHAPPPTRGFQRRRRAAVLLVLVLVLVFAVVVLVVGQVMREKKTVDTATAAPIGSALPRAAAGPLPTFAATEPPVRNVPPDAADTTPSAAVVAAAAGGFTFAGGYGPVLGSTGPVRRFKVAVEKQIGQADGGDFAGEVDRILGDPRSWIAGREFRLQRVPSAAAAEFTVYLASAATSEKMCAAGGLRTAGYTSCRLPGHVIINSERWAEAVPDYGAPLAVYRAYAINHEVGHQFGHGHEACAGRGEPAPVMMQQTYGLQGCVANSWPYLRGERYAGNPID